VLSRRALNRATLERQMLLRRSNIPTFEAIERLVGLQAQTTQSWYLGLWSRLEDFKPEELGRMLLERKVVRIALMRSTIHLVTSRDCLSLRALVQPVIERSTKGVFGRHWVGLDEAAVKAAGRKLVEERPRTFTELGNLLAKQWPGRNAEALAQAMRAWLPLVQVPPRGVWGASGPAAHTTVEEWLGRRLLVKPSLEKMIMRYLAAFGPATVMDIQTWSGMTRLAEIVERMRAKLVTFRNEGGRELFDIPEAARPGADAPAPPRFLYDYDNLLLSYADRTRVITDGYHKQGFRIDGPMPCILLVDGFTNGTWKIARERARATLIVQPFKRLSRKDSNAVTAEGYRLLSFAAAGTATHDVKLMAPN
jgi:hypothetical protein